MIFEEFRCKYSKFYEKMPWNSTKTKSQNYEWLNFFLRIDWIHISWNAGAHLRGYEESIAQMAFVAFCNESTNFIATTFTTEVQNEIRLSREWKCRSNIAILSTNWKNWIPRTAGVTTRKFGWNEISKVVSIYKRQVFLQVRILYAVPRYLR